MKRMNNGEEPRGSGQTPAEIVEKSPSAKGNPIQTTVTSTQGLESASSGLDRVREKARRDKERLLGAYRALNTIRQLSELMM
jgi:hypothetical protein